jgi:hypothetical protein
MLAQEMMTYFKNINFTEINLLSLPRVGGIILILAFVIGLSMPAWDNGKFLLIVPLPLSLGIYFNLLILEPLNALIVCGMVFLVTSLGITASNKLKNLLLKNLPSITLRPAIKGYLFAISIAATFIVLLNPQGQETSIISAVSKAISSPIQGYLSKEAGINPYMGANEKKVLEEQINLEVTDKVKKAIEPYRHLLNVFMAIAVFVGMQGLNALVYLLFSLLITPLFWLFKKANIILVDLEEVRRECLHF